MKRKLTKTVVSCGKDKRVEIDQAFVKREKLVKEVELDYNKHLNTIWPEKLEE